jgi:hypothetical protein
MKNKPYDPGYTLEDCEELADEIIKSLDIPLSNSYRRQDAVLAPQPIFGVTIGILLAHPEI